MTAPNYSVNGTVTSGVRRLTGAGCVSLSSRSEPTGSLGGNMFGMFSKKDNGKDRVKLAIRQEFDQTIAVARVAPLSKQARVGKGIVDAFSDFNSRYTKEGVQQLSFQGP